MEEAICSTLIVVWNLVLLYLLIRAKRHYEHLLEELEDQKEPVDT